MKRRKTCPECGGAGEVRSNPSGDPQREESSTCPVCNGSGVVTA